MKIYKCYDKHGSYKLLFSHDGIIYCDNSLGNGKAIYTDEFTKIKRFETGDTLQEVVDWCEDNNHCVEITPFGFNFHGDVPGGKQHVLIKNKAELLAEIRKPKLKEVTAEELAEMGYRLKKD